MKWIYGKPTVTNLYLVTVEDKDGTLFTSNDQWMAVANKWQSWGDYVVAYTPLPKPARKVPFTKALFGRIFGS